jgi:hypothetical protein
MKPNKKELLVLLIIYILAAFFRLFTVDWDQGTHLHPDERFLTMVGVDMSLPLSFADYMDPASSPFNPVNITDDNGSKKYPFFVYGTFPITLNKLFSLATFNDTYDGFTIAGRVISAFLDLMIVLLIFKSVQLFEKHYQVHKNIKYLAAFFYAIAVLPIQLSHFFTVDTFLNTFLFTAWYFTVQYHFTKKYIPLTLSAVFLGFALGSKVTSLFILPLLLFIIAAAHINLSGKDIRTAATSLYGNKRKILLILGNIVLFLLVAYLSLRIANPYMFQSAALINPSISSDLLANWHTLKTWEGNDIWFPPAVQWMNTAPVLFAFKNLTLFGFGIVSGLFAFSGMIQIFAKRKYAVLIWTFLWITVFFIYQSTQFVKNARYFIIIYPFLSIAAAYALSSFMKKLHPVFTAVILIILLLWPLSFLSIYAQPHSRIQASEWIYQNIPYDSTIAWEHWDDPLPLSLRQYPFQYTLIELPVFGEDTPEKWEKMNELLEKADYYILSSNRGWGSIGRVPEKYPLMSRFYQELFAENNGFIKIKEFTSYPSLKYLGIPFTIPDDAAEESFTVYDHPRVIIFKKQ